MTLITTADFLAATAFTMEGTSWEIQKHSEIPPNVGPAAYAVVTDPMAGQAVVELVSGLIWAEDGRIGAYAMRAEGVHPEDEEIALGEHMLAWGRNLLAVCPTEAKANAIAAAMNRQVAQFTVSPEELVEMIAKAVRETS